MDNRKATYILTPEHRSGGSIPADSGSQRSKLPLGEEAIAKSIYTREYEIFLERLRQARLAAGLNQREVAERMQESILFVSRCERGERRMDVIELRAFCRAINVSPGDFLAELEKVL